MKLDKIKIGKLNILDLTILLIVFLFAIIFIFSKFEANGNISNEVNTKETSNTFTYTIFIESLSDTSTEMFKIGDLVYDKVSNVYIGKIVDIEIVPAKGLIGKNNGELIEANIPGKINVNLKIEANGTIKDGEYLANNLIRILVGNTKQIKTKYIMCMGTVTSIDI